jgi:hypothetical protein
MEYIKSNASAQGRISDLGQTQAPEGEMQRGLRRLHEFNGRLAELRNKASRLADHMCGSTPQNPNKSIAVAEGISSMGRSMNEALDLANSICGVIDENLQNSINSVGA